MKTELYPAFEDVFIDHQLRGIFYPLCSVVTEDDHQITLHFVSHNGVWMAEANRST